MKKLLIVTAGLLCSITAAYPQANYKIHTSPKLPRRDALERMNLTLAWNARVPVEGDRDGFFSFQLIPGTPKAQLLAETYEGAVYLFDAENGDLIWKTKVGVAYWTPQPLGYNSQAIFATRRNFLYVLNRVDGAQRVYTVDDRTRLVNFGYEMGFSPSAGPVADEDTLYVSMGNRVRALEIPDFVQNDRARQARERELRGLPRDAAATPAPGGADSPQPDFYWGYSLVPDTTEFSPLVWGEQVSILTSSGTLVSVPRTGRGVRADRFEFKTNGRVIAAAGQHGNVAYVGSDDFSLYAVNMNTGNLVWRHVSGARILSKPDVTDRDVFIAPERVGLRRLDRSNGREVWTNRDATRFLAASANYVYALDHNDKFFVLDGRRGTTLASHDFLNWAIHISNEWTDRVYLAANDGQILCLRPRDNVRPLTMKTWGPMKEEERQPIRPKKEEKKPMEKKEEKEDKEKAAVDGNQAGSQTPFGNPRLSKLRFAEPLIAWEITRETEFRDDAFPNRSSGTSNTLGTRNVLPPFRRGGGGGETAERQSWAGP